MSSSWLPTASIETLKLRSALIKNIRQFFYERNILEVETPCLSHHTVTDPYLEALQCEHTEPGANTCRTLFLQTSPEYAMKRLLAAGSGDIFQLCKSFRNDEVGHQHNPEFTMLEWYRLNFSMQNLIDELVQLLMTILPINSVEQETYAELFIKYCDFDPLSISLTSLIEVCEDKGLGDYIQGVKQHLVNGDKASKINDKGNENNSVLLKDSALQVLFHQEIEPHIGKVVPMVVSHFPSSQASLATMNEDGVSANRFEVYYLGMELANGFNELQDAAKQEARFNDDNKKREQLGLTSKTLDTHFIAALNAGLPACSGVALGIDRLIMLALNKTHIKDVVSFSYDNC